MSATLTEPQADWLRELVPPTGGGSPPMVAKSDAAKARLTLRAQVLAEVAGQVDRLKPDLQKAFKDYKIEKGGKLIPLHDDSLNPDESISVKGDLRDDDEGSPKIVGDARTILATLKKAYDQLLVQQDVLRSAGMDDQQNLTRDGSGARLFSDADIQAELWTPLVREGIMPEDQVIDRFSEMQQTFEGAKTAYAQRLEAFGETAEPEAGGVLSGLAGNGATVLETVGKFTKLAGTILPELSDKVADRKWLEELKETTSFAVGLMEVGAGVLKGTEALLTSKDGLEVAEHFVKAIGPAAKLLPVEKTFQDVFPKVCSSLLANGKFFHKLVAGDFAAAGNALADAIGDGLEAVAKLGGDDQLEVTAGRAKGLIKSAVASVVLISKRSASRDEIIGAWEGVAKEVGGVLINEIGLLKKSDQEVERVKISESLQRTLELAKGTIETVTEICLNVPDIPQAPDDADKALEGAVNECATAIEKLAQDYATLRKETRGDQIGPLSEQLQEQVDLVNRKAEAVDQMSKALNQKLIEAYKNKDDRTAEEDDEDEPEDVEDPGGWDKAETLARLKAAKAGMFPEDEVLAQIEAQALQGVMDEESENFARALRDDVVAGDDDPAVAGRVSLQNIDKLIEQLKVDKAWFKIGNTLADLGVKAGAKWLEQLGPLATLKDMMLSMYAAYQRAGELAKWQEGAKDSRNAGAYALAAAQLNRAGIEASALTQDKIKATLKTVQLVGEALKLTGVAGLYGAALNATAQGVEIGRGLLTQYFSAQQMDAAWDAYERALRNPGDRKLQREALRGNATLAKYALAWAAVEGGNPLAREAMRKCGLDDKVLASKDTDAQKVVKYLETMFDEDPIVLRVSPRGEDWWPGTPELTARNWNRFSSAAAKAAPPLDANSSVLVTKALAQLDKVLPAALADRKNPSVVEPAWVALTAVRSALRAYSPRDDEGRAHAGMQTYTDAMAALAELNLRALPAPVAP